MKILTNSNSRWMGFRPRLFLRFGRRPYPVRNRTLIPALALSMGVLVACNFIPGNSAVLNDPPLATASTSGTATHTPFAPLQPTTTLTATLQASAAPTFDPERPWGSFPGPTDPSAIEIPPPADPVELGPNAVTYLLLGSDARSTGGGYRTDVMMVVTLDPDQGTATLLSIPRDLYVYIPGWKVNRINTADPRGGFEMMRNTILYNFGIPVDYWARIDFGGFMNAVDLLGGIDVEVTKYLGDKCGRTFYEFFPGNTYQMNGWTAHCYVRMRKASSDFDRLRKQQEVIKAIFRKAISIDGLTNVPALYSQFNSMVRTNVGLSNSLTLLHMGTLLAFEESRIRGYTIDSSMTTSFRTPSGGAVQLPVWESIKPMIENAFGS